MFLSPGNTSCNFLSKLLQDTACHKKLNNEALETSDDSTDHHSAS